MKIEYNKPIEVTKTQCAMLCTHLGGTFAWRKDENNRYFVKLWMMKYVEPFKQILSYEHTIRKKN